LALLDARDRQEIAQAIAEVERHTDAELVTVLAARSDDYREEPLLWSALIALAVPVALLPFGVSSVFLVAVQLAVFCILVPIFHIPAVALRLVPKELRLWRAANMARRQFFDLSLHHTAGSMGLLIFVSEAEHYVEIIADRGISSQVDDARWEAIVAAFIDDVRAGRVCGGFVSAITACGDVLTEVVPKTPDNRNELDDRLILLGYD